MHGYIIKLKKGITNNKINIIPTITPIDMPVIFNNFPKLFIIVIILIVNYSSIIQSIFLFSFLILLYIHAKAIILNVNAAASEMGILIQTPSVP